MIFNLLYKLFSLNFYIVPKSKNFITNTYKKLQRKLIL